MAEHWEDRRTDFLLTDKTNGIIRVAAPVDTLRWWAIWLADLGSAYYRGTDHRYLSTTFGSRFPEAEVQVFRWFTPMVNDAVTIREKMFPGASNRELLDHERPAIHDSLPKNHADRSSS